MSNSRGGIWISWVTGFALCLAGSAHAEEPSEAEAEVVVGTKPLVHRGRACTSSERWTFTEAVPKEYAKDFNSGKLKPVQGFSEGISLRRFGKGPSAKTFAEFWIARSLNEAGLAHIAFEGFASIAARPPMASTAGIQVAALDCMLQIHAKYPTLLLPDRVTVRLADFAKYAAESEVEDHRTVINEAAIAELVTLLADPKTTEARISRTFALLEGSGAFSDLATALWASRRNAHARAIDAYDRFLKTASMPSGLKRFVDLAHVGMARSLYAAQAFEVSVQHLKQVKKSSNRLAETLSELSWSYLMADQLPEAIGTAMSLQAGGLRHTYAPEGPMVMAMALNELCQYPESIKAIHFFRGQYETSYRWLADWKSQSAKGQGPNLYKLAIDFIRRKGQTPERLASEWVRSPLFIAAQEEINLLFQEKSGSQALARTGSTEQRRLALEITRTAQELKLRIRSERAHAKSGEALSASLVSKLVALKRDILHFRRLRAAAPYWRAVLGRYQKQAPNTEKSLMVRINEDLNQRTDRMLTQLEEIAENTQLIEVEIFNGASQDIIWQNAHPDYKEIAKQMKDEAQKVAAEQTWDWGKSAANLSDDAEIWEDELGSFKANLYDNCSSKDKYLALKTATRGLASAPQK